MEYLDVVISFAALAALCLFLYVRCDLPASLTPLATVSGTMVWFSIAGMAGLLRPMGWAWFVLAAAAGAAGLWKTSPKKLARAFRRVHTFLMPGGLFLFDANTPDKLRALDGQVFLDEDEDAYCVWRAEFSPRRRVCTYGMDIFRLEPGGLWSRGEEVHEEYAYEPAELEAMLGRAGFSHIRQYGELKFRAPLPGEGRIFFAARKEF